MKNVFHSYKPKHKDTRKLVNNAEINKKSIKKHKWRHYREIKKVSDKIKKKPNKISDQTTWWGLTTNSTSSVASFKCGAKRNLQGRQGGDG